MSMKEKLAGLASLDVRQVYVEALDETLYVSPFTVGELNQLQRKHPGFPQTASLEAMIDALIMKAKDKDGKPLFTIEHKPEMRRIPATVFMEIAGSVFADFEVDAGEVEKN